MISFMYLHGLLSSSMSQKGILLKDKLERYGKYYTPDFYPTQQEFEQMKVGLLLDKVSNWVDQVNNSVVLVGSSFGGLIATRYVQLQRMSDKVVGLILLAPALDYYHMLEDHLLPSKQWREWRKQGYLLVEHPTWEQKTKWSWSFIQDLQENHDPMDEPVTVPTLLIHGEEDEVIPVANSRQYVAKQARLGYQWTAYYLPGGTHKLLNVLSDVIKLILNWLKTNSLIIM
ncbi:MAG: YqiA/YcfP family alpha/beta fold hydrolase [Candidatus Heimdallarchaeota archaeon]